MACILLTDMDRPVQAHLRGSPPDQEPAQAKGEEQAACLVVHLYNRVKDGGGGGGGDGGDGGGCGAKGSEGTLAFPPGEFAAEELCISAARACGELQGNFSCGFTLSHTHTNKEVTTHLAEMLDAATSPRGSPNDSDSRVFHRLPKVQRSAETPDKTCLTVSQNFFLL